MTRHWPTLLIPLSRTFNLDALTKNYPLLMRSLFSASALKGIRSGRCRVICERER